ncbi:hypothetical protein GA707_04360 [Nostocoides sp. F2B08]|uniref:hypothetical protein n=1 Tax=Nostocoides sp. F2B08 TaxID=2653936 RepID=UPI00126329C1|nr:hypothetical protein [Tetrasphaera sp. F2B08]KAB7745197.1 hypothetical protein GA707_04360 [Tetrasphaera sp. F2B08]
MRAPTRILVSHALAATAMGAAWPLLLAAVWAGTGSAWWLGVAGAARMAPYVLCSWWVGHFADRFSRSRIVMGTLVARVVLLAASGVALWADLLGLAVLLSALVVAVATPAYPALVAGLPAVPGARARSTEWLVTIEVCSFVVGPAVGGLLLGVPGLVIPLATGATAIAVVVMRGVDLPAPSGTARRGRTGWHAVLAASSQARRTLGLLAMINFVLAGVGITLLPMATGDWAAPWSTEAAFGIGTAVLGFGALGAPLLLRLGRGPVRRTLCGLALMSGGIVLLGLAPAVLAALPALGVIGAAAVHAEGNATRHLQGLIPDDSRASVFGLGDTVMVGAALAGSLVAPPLAEILGARVLLVATAISLIAMSGLIRTVPVPAPAARQAASV